MRRIVNINEKYHVLQTSRLYSSFLITTRSMVLRGFYVFACSTGVRPLPQINNNHNCHTLRLHLCSNCLKHKFPHSKYLPMYLFTCANLITTFVQL